MKKSIKKKRIKKNIIKKLLLFLILLLCGFTIVYFYNRNKTDEFNEFLSTIETNKINVDKYYIYGTHLNIEGSSNEILDNFKDIKLILKTRNTETEFNIHYDNDNNFKFNTSNLLNEGIDLQTLTENDYYILLKVIYEDKIKYYTFKNNTNYSETNYYSLSNNDKTNKMNIKFNDYMIISVKQINKPNDVYDIVIDPGHGGIDSGAVYKNYNEANLTLEYSTLLKKKLENLGYKVKLTREDKNGISSYGNNSRTSIPYEVKTKYLFSIHFNSTEPYIYNSGVEIYTANHINLDFASYIVKNINDNTNMKYSSNTAFKEKNGVYIRTMSTTNLNDMREEAKENNYEPYNATTDTPYLFMIRETGGFMTKAYVDGRNKKYGKNEYYNSNIGSESYLLELGYINSDKDLNIILNDENNYVSIIAEAIDEYIKNDN